MKKLNNNGFMLVETLIVTTFVAGVLVYIFIQFSNLSKNYETSYDYNTVVDLYSLKNIKQYIESDSLILNYINSEVTEDKYIDISDCSNFTHENYCLKLFELENIDSIIISTNNVKSDILLEKDMGFLDFVKKIKEEGTEKYRIIASFKDNTYATVRFGE